MHDEKTVPKTPEKKTIAIGSLDLWNTLFMAVHFPETIKTIRATTPTT